MNIIEIIEKKRLRGKLNQEDINYFVQEYVSGKIKDYQMSSLLMAICLNGMDEDETTNLTKAMLYSGDMMDLKAISGLKVDKHSTGGVGDKVTLVVGPLAASVGLKFAKMSGRGLGHTGGTIDKLEGIEGFRTNLTTKDFLAQVEEHGMAIISQTENLVPADKLIYALRDASGTVNSIPLIAASIMSKKLASSADIIVLDVKVGRGAFMKNLREARKLASLMVRIGRNFNKEIVAILTDMNMPLGKAIGNNLEVKEALESLKGEGPEDLLLLSLEITAHLGYLGKVFSSLEEGKKILLEKIKSQEAYHKFINVIASQGGNIKKLISEGLEEAKGSYEIKANTKGYITSLDALKIGKAVMLLGAGRTKKDEKIDYTTGIVLEKKVGDKVNEGDTLLRVWTNKSENSEADELIINAFKFGKKPKRKPLILEIISD